jgi:hypothetical protein
MNGHIRNESSRDLWVVADGKAHLLAPRRRSPDKIDADGARAKDGTAIDGHRSWWKVNDLGNMTIKDKAGSELTMDATFGTTTAVEDGEFGDLKFDDTVGWGDAIV